MMRECYELAFITAYIYSKGDYPNLVHINDTQFIAPVPYGSMIHFGSQITFVKDNLVHVHVTADTIQKDMKNWGRSHRTNEFNVTFELT